MKYYIYNLSIFLILYHLNNQAATKSQNEPIILGLPASEGLLPWHVILRRDAGDQLLCGGSLISDKWVLTCAHCIFDINSVLLVFGSIHLSDSEFNMTSTTFFIYPDYNDDDLINDLALIELPAPVIITVNIYPVKLITAEDAATHDFLGDEALICGFGWTSDAADVNSEDLLWTIVEAVNNTVCEEAYDEPMEDTIICARGYDNTYRSPCDGDSGGALIWKNESGVISQIGIYSFSKELKCSQYPSGYTRVSSFLDYIHNITGI